MNGIQVLKKVKEKIKKINNVLTKHRHGHGHEHDRGEQHIPDDHDLDDKDAEEYDVGQIYQQGHGGAPVEPVRGPNTSHGHEALPHHARPLGALSDRRCH
ncbi:hypothetical protein YC2023_035951 [Brassica napus]